MLVLISNLNELPSKLIKCVKQKLTCHIKYAPWMWHQPNTCVGVVVFSFALNVIRLNRMCHNRQWHRASAVAAPFSYHVDCQHAGTARSLCVLSEFENWKSRHLSYLRCKCKTIERVIKNAVRHDINRTGLCALFCEMLKTNVFALFFAFFLFTAVLFWLLISFLGEWMFCVAVCSGTIEKIRKSQFSSHSAFGDNDMLQNGPKCYRLNVSCTHHHAYIHRSQLYTFSVCFIGFVHATK